MSPVSMVVIAALVSVSLVVIAVGVDRLQDRLAERDRLTAEADAALRDLIAADTREYDVLDLDLLGSRQLRQLHGLTATELATKRAADERDEAWEWARITQALTCDADFRAIATQIENEFPQT